MIMSMTGFGKKEIHNNDISITIELKSINSRYFELNHKRSIFATRLSSYVKEKLYGRCAVVGGGIYGVTVATKLKVSGYDVHLYEAENDILNRASGINQYRIHRGYHYPRSMETIESC